MKESNSEDVAAAARGMDFNLGWFAQPIWGKLGDYPACMRERLGATLPTFTREEKELIMGSSDFFGVNSYRAELAEQLSKHAAGRTKLKGFGVAGESGVVTTADKDWEKTDQGWAICPW